MFDGKDDSNRYFRLNRFYCVTNFWTNEKPQLWRLQKSCVTTVVEISPTTPIENCWQASSFSNWKSISWGSTVAPQMRWAQLWQGILWKLDQTILCKQIVWLDFRIKAHDIYWAKQSRFKILSANISCRFLFEFPIGTWTENLI